MRVRFRGHVARARLLYWSEQGFAIEPPISRDGPVACELYETVTLEIAQSSGVALVRAKVAQVGALVAFESPSFIRLWDRREVKRAPVDVPVCIDGEVGRMVDVSEQGCRVNTKAAISRGERVSVDVPHRGRVFGWALAVGDGFVRLRFEDPFLQ